MLRVISLGAGVQSTTMLLMALRGEFGDHPDLAIFADTGAEPAHVYRHLEWLTDESQRLRPGFQIISCNAGNIETDVLAAARGEIGRVSTPPFFAKSNDGGVLFRQCTRDYKVRPLDKLTRALMRERGEKITEKWFGISLDEVQRMKDPTHPYFRHRYPLIYDKAMTRRDCLLWMESHGYPKPPKSACYFCPYHSDNQWRELRDQHPEEWQKAVSLDGEIRNGIAKCTSELYLHSSMKPLAEVDLSTLEEKGQMTLFDSMCDTGMCGV